MIEVTYLVLLSCVVFVIGIVGVGLNRNNLVAILMNIELMLIAVNINFIAFSNYHQNLEGHIAVFFVLAIAAAEAAIGLAIFVKLYERYHSIQADKFSSLKELA
ncbi:NADH-quinone oxidoreductase subunit NuoK [Candidatus Comchoanobacter bicostacola]|uniref:NADH-quinone oxidoreductase subunit K n=1 Tax=Candidatus Comchoanobacter bicostacola TaxID=2919598 RepID=A0ABY5DJX9_9GAMM|nr:NADH-quinone oxidoreductase subunit NuoK [Candidatus Comchoanobacter bicostacola]UTC24793.1 NADH-quinone oxidoreductase subunit NuoK [Candidatus Comchoanobacter bicostacola]